MMKKRIKAIVKGLIPPVFLSFYYYVDGKFKRRGAKKFKVDPRVKKLFPNETVKCTEVGLHERIYRGTKYIIYEGVVCPTHGSNFRFLDYLMKNVVRSGDDVIDLCSGSGAVGISLLNEANIRSLSLLDLNYQAIRSQKATISVNKLQGVKCWLSDGFENVPLTEKFDVILANPPVDSNRPTLTLEGLAGGDPEFNFHKKVFSVAHNYIKKEGMIIFCHGKVGPQTRDHSCCFECTC